MTSRDPSLVRNMIVNFGGFAISILVALFIAPVMLRSLGDARYGVWSLVGQLTGYYGLLDLGIRGAVSFYVGRSLATKQDESLREYTASAFWGLSVVGAVVLLIGGGLVIALPHVFDLEGVRVGEARTALLIMSVAIAVGLPMATLSAILVGAKRLDVVNGIEAPLRVVGAVVIYVVLTNGGGLVSLAVIQSVRSVVTWSLQGWFVRRTGSVSFSPTRVTRKAFRNLTGYGLKQTVMNLAALVIEKTDLIVVGIFVGVTGVTYYNIGAALVHYAWGACAALIFAFTPHMTHMYARGETEETRVLLLRGTRLISFLTCGLTACMLAFGDKFIALWLGERFVTGDWMWRSDIIMALLLLANLPRMLFGVSRQLLFASARQVLLAWLMTAEAIANLVLSLVLVRSYGLVGVALGTLIPQVITQMIIMPRYVMRTFEIPPRKLIGQSILQPIAISCVVYAVARGLAVYGNASGSWFRFGALAAATVLIGGSLVWLVGMSAEERKMFLARFGIQR